MLPEIERFVNWLPRRLLKGPVQAVGSSQSDLADYQSEKCFLDSRLEHGIIVL